MATYVIGDVQGCFASLKALVQRMNFDPAHDHLWLAGDLVNRGPDSLGVLRWAAGMGDAVNAVLGNHDLYLLARALDVRSASSDDTLSAILRAPDKDTLIEWLAHRPLIASVGQWLIVHAGLLAPWTTQQALDLAEEASERIRGPGRREAISVIFGPDKSSWRSDLSPDQRLSAVVAAMTRLRCCTLEGAPVRFVGAPENAPPGTCPWFRVPSRQSQGRPIIFGHWAHLGLYMSDDAVGIDTGCLYGGHLTALRLEDRTVFQQESLDAIQGR